jgi:hypothetical protein
MGPQNKKKFNYVWRSTENLLYTHFFGNERASLRIAAACFADDTKGRQLSELQPKVPDTCRST